MDGIVKCASCGCIDSEIGERTVFCSGCNAALGIVNKRVIEWDTKMVQFDGIMRQVFSGKQGPQEVAEEFGGESLNHKVALNGMNLQAKMDKTNIIANRIKYLLDELDEQVALLRGLVNR